MSKFIIGLKNPSRFQEFAQYTIRLDVAITHINASEKDADKVESVIFEYAETHEGAVGATMRILEDFGTVLRCQ